MDHSGELIFQSIKAVLFTIPQIIAYIVGLILSLILWRHNGKVAGIAFIAFGLSLIMIIASPFVYMLLPGLFGHDMHEFMYIGIRILHTIMHTFVIALFIAAIFMHRKKTDSLPQHDEQNY